MNWTDSFEGQLHPIIIRPIEENDIPDVLAVYRQCQDFLALGPNPIATSDMVQQDIEHSYREGGQYCVIVDSNGQITGVIDYLPSHFEGHPEQAFISLLMIAAPYRRHGLGHQVLHQIETEIQINDQIRSITTAVQVNNPLALHFWQKNGYRIVSGPEIQDDTTITYRLQKGINMKIQDLETRFLEWALTQEDFRAAFIVGSQARRDHPADQFSDLDIILLVHDVESRYQDSSWLEEIAPLWLSHMGHTINGEPERLVLFAGGFQVDFVFHPVEVAPQFQQMVAAGNLPDTIQRGTRILFDKDGLLPVLPDTTRIPSVPDPTENEFRQTLDSFWFNAVYCAKQLKRGELWLFQNSSGGMIWPLLRMVEWQARALHGRDYDTWHAGKFIAQWADPEVYASLQHVFAHLESEDSWRALQTRLSLMHDTARKLATALDYSYPFALEQNISKCVQEIRGVQPTISH